MTDRSGEGGPGAIPQEDCALQCVLERDVGQRKTRLTHLARPSKIRKCGEFTTIDGLACASGKPQANPNENKCSAALFIVPLIAASLTPSTQP